MIELSNVLLSFLIIFSIIFVQNYFLTSTWQFKSPFTQMLTSNKFEEVRQTEFFPIGRTYYRDETSHRQHLEINQVKFKSKVKLERYLFTRSLSSLSHGWP